MPDKDLTLHLKIDRSQAQAARRQDAEDAKAHEKEVFTAAEVNEKAKVELVKKTNRERINAAVEAAEKEKEGWKSTGEAIGGATQSVMAFGGQMLGLASAGAAVQAIVGAFEKARQTAYAATKMVTDYRAALLELAALKGNTGNTTTEAKEQVAFRGVTLQDQAAATEYQSRALPGLGGAEKQGFLTPTESQKALVMGGMFQSTEKGDAAAHGSMVGLIPQLIGHQTNAQEVFGKEAQLKKIFDAGGFKFAEGAGQFSGLAELATSHTYEPLEMASLLSAFSATKIPGTGGSAQDRLKQFTTATLGGIDYTRAGSVEEGESRGKYYKQLGMTDEWVKSQKPDQLAMAIGNTVSADLAKVQERGENPMVYLQHHGYGNQQDRESMLQYSTLKQSGRLDTEFMPLAHEDTGAAGSKLLGDIMKAQQSDPALLMRRGKLNEQFANLARGAGTPEDLEAARQGAFNRMRASGDTPGYTSYDELKNGYGLDPSSGTIRGKLDVEAYKGLRGQAEKLGVTEDSSLGFASFDEKIMSLAGRVKAAGGDILPDMGDVQNAAQKALSSTTQGPGVTGDEALKKLDTMIDLMRQQVSPGPAPTPAALPGAPRVPAMR